MGLLYFHNENYYGQFGQYNGKAKIDDHEMIADGAGLTPLKLTTPEEDQG